jgi:hypothetical protein
MPTSARIMLLLLLVVAPALPAAPDADDVAPFVISVLRRDGITIPFAAFDGKNWSTPWPQGPEKDPPADLGSIPRAWWGKTGPPSELTAWADGASRGAIHIDPGKPALLHIRCANLGLATDYRSREPPPAATVQPYPKDGLAVSGAQQVGLIRILTPESDEWMTAAREMTVDFDEAEERAAHTFIDWSHPFNKVQRRRFVPRIEAMYGAPMDEAGWTAYFLEAVRLYPPAPDDRGCGLVASVNGWMTVGPNGKRSFNLRARITYCDREGVRYMLPLGLIKVSDRSYWVYQMSGYDFESYVVARPRPKEIITEVQYSAGHCPF